MYESKIFYSTGMRPVLTVLLACGLLAPTAALPLPQERVQIGFFDALPSSGLTTPLEIRYLVKPTRARRAAPQLVLTFRPEGGGPPITRTAVLRADSRGVWKGAVPKGQLVIRGMNRACVSTLTVKVTGAQEDIRLSYVFNGTRRMEEKMFIKGRRIGGGACG